MYNRLLLQRAIALSNKRLSWLTFCFLFLTCVLSNGCGDNSVQMAQVAHMQQWMSDNGKPKVLSTTAIVGDIVARIGGDEIDHIALITGEIDPHSYEIVKGDDEKLSRADLLFSSGLGLEHGASLRYKIEHHKKAIALGDAIRSIVPEKILYRNQRVDPHVWMDIELWSFSIDSIVEALSQVLPDKKELFVSRGESLRQELLATHAAIKEKMQNISKEKRFLVTSHDAFHYFTRAYLATEEERGSEGWRERCHAPEGLAPDGQISPVDIQRIIDHLLSHRIEKVFAESNVSQDALRKIIEACQSQGKLSVEMALKPLYGDAMGSSSSYKAMIEHDADVLLATWQKRDE